MQTRREYLVGLGLAKEGRGKFSGAAKQALEEARGKGIKFSDEVVEEVTKPTGEKVTEVKTKQKTEIAPWVSPDEYRFPEGVYQAYYVENGRRVSVGMREACQNCGLSICDHRCNEPTVLGRLVTIERVA